MPAPTRASVRVAPFPNLSKVFGQPSTNTATVCSMENIKQIIQVHSESTAPCPDCNDGPDLGTKSDAWLDIQVNHLLGHGYKILHTGQETTSDPDGNPWQRTTVVLGALGG